MSGISGICQPNRLFRQSFLEPMLKALVVDDLETNAALSGESVALGVSRRFSGQEIGCIGDVWVCADTDLLNIKSLKALAAAKGLGTSANVAELIASLYLLFGPELVHRLDGAFAFALWDGRNKRMLLAIDRLGIKNLYWHVAEGALVFGTRINALRAAVPSLEMNHAALTQFLLFSMVPAPLTVFKDTQKLCPGFMLRFEDGRITQERYWDLHFSEERRSEEEWTQMVRNELRASVHRHLQEAEPAATGAFLSGGTDSSTVVAFMSERHSPVHTFSAIFEESSYSEEQFMRAAGQKFPVQQHDCLVHPKDAVEAIPRIFKFYEEPYANSSAIAAYFCSVAARQAGVNLLLGGDGGDELFAGNERYATEKYFALYGRIPALLRRAVIEPAARLLPPEHKYLSLPRRYIRRANIPNPQRYYSYNFFLSFPPREIFSQDLLSAGPRENWLEIPQSHFSQPHDASELNRLLYVDVKMILADNDLKKVSGMGELAGIQVRYPLCDYRLAELAARIPTSLKLRRFEKRYIFKQAMKGILPDVVLYKKKHGMGVPVSSWLLNDPRLHAFATEVLRDSRTTQRGYFQPGFLDQLFRLQSQEHIAYYGEIVWYLLALELWHREHLDHSERLVCAH